MIIIPAIDLHNGQVVRLQQGEFDKVTQYGHDPVDVAKTWKDVGAQRIHIVDLDGSVQGRGMNVSVIEAVCKNVDVDIEVGGGIRSEQDALHLFQLGVSFVILGSIIIDAPDKAKKILERFPGKVAIGIDAKDGKVAIHGWKDVTDIDATTLAKDFENLNPAFVVYTDIKRDGMLTGPNIEATSLLVQQIKTPVVASGGVSCFEDLIALEKIPGLLGVITGKALYEGRINLKEAIAKIQKS